MGGGGYNQWVGHSVVKPVDDEQFQRIKSIKEGSEEKKRLWYDNSKRRCSRKGIKHRKEDSISGENMEKQYMR